jgi:antitoxin component of MazEF toxin-antitoxin module
VFPYLMIKPDLPKYLKLRKMGNSLYLIVPREFAKAHTLNPHDDVYWLPESDGIKLKFRAQDAEAA